MKKLFQIFFMMLLFTAFIYPQVIFDSVTVSDQTVVGTKVLVFGCDTAATDGIDLQFGEGLLPPFPPAGAFEARFFLPENGFSGTAASWRDFRDIPGIPFTGQKEFRLAYQLGSGTVIRVSWNFPTYITGTLQDLFGGVLINVPISGTGFFNVVPALDRLKMTINYTAAIPVELASFKASVNGNTVTLNWQTATEVNNRGFEVERKIQGTGWQMIGFVPGAGNSTQVQAYSFIDQNLSVGSYTYRLKQLDLDGHAIYSYPVNAEVGTISEYSLNQNYPNPFNPNTVIEFTVPEAQDVTITIFDVLGREVRSLYSAQVEAGKYRVQWNGLNNNGEQLSSGTYVYRIKAGQFSDSKKMILMR